VAIVYTPIGEPFRLNLSSLACANLRATWIDPRTGQAAAAASLERGADVKFEPPVPGDDWALVLASDH
jgi:NAD-dependent oxidoreductase involved in siderophore biosynthesis